MALVRRVGVPCGGGLSALVNYYYYYYYAVCINREVFKWLKHTPYVVGHGGDSHEKWMLTSLSNAALQMMQQIIAARGPTVRHLGKLCQGRQFSEN